MEMHGAGLLQQGPSTPTGHVHMHSGYEGGVMYVHGLTIKAPCSTVMHDACDQIAWSDSHIIG
jgi:hypothetical protein